MNQIVNMVIRLVMRKLLNKGIDAGFDRAAQMRSGKTADKPQLDDDGNHIHTRTTEQELRANKRAGRKRNQQSRQAKQAVKAIRRLNKF